MNISVLVASYKRPLDLERCLRGLAEQTLPAYQVVVVLRDTDVESWKKMEAIKSELNLPLKILEVRQPGVLAANNVALPHCTGEIVSFIDDDACPAKDWLARIAKHFRNPRIGALGGRDRFAHPLMKEETERSAKVVGKIRWYGKIINYHHRQSPGARPVDSLKGCNMSYRRSLLGLCDEGLIGNACYYELDLCFRVKAQGYEVWFDGDLLVDHYLAESHLDRFKRGDFHPDRVFTDYHNRSRVLMRHLKGPRKWVAAAYWLGVAPQLGFARYLVSRQSAPVKSWVSSVKGVWRGARSLR